MAPGRQDIRHDQCQAFVEFFDQPYSRWRQVYDRELPRGFFSFEMIRRKEVVLEAVQSYLQGRSGLVATCAFKKLEEDESVQRLRHFRKYGPEMVVFGCLPDIAEDRYREFADIPTVAPREIACRRKFRPRSFKKNASRVSIFRQDRRQGLLQMSLMPIY